MNVTINNILTAFNARIQSKDWLDNTTKQKCEEKVSSVVSVYYTLTHTYIHTTFIHFF